MSDLEDDLMQVDFAVELRMSWCTTEDEELNCIEALASELREGPLVPPKPGDLSTHFPECNTGICFPACHFAIKDCPWTSARMTCYHRCPESGIWSGHDGMWCFWGAVDMLHAELWLDVVTLHVFENILQKPTVIVSCKFVDLAQSRSTTACIWRPLLTRNNKRCLWKVPALIDVHVVTLLLI